MDISLGGKFSENYPNLAMDHSAWYLWDQEEADLVRFDNHVEHVVEGNLVLMRRDAAGQVMLMETRECTLQ